jgi:hypothetical protein
LEEAVVFYFLVANATNLCGDENNNNEEEEDGD